ncbi:MBL fold metallo-hydrolase [Leptospira kobayashii]|nr:MBL fold metallo-hydrolase [Leptospira kobayashii]
MKGSIMKFKKLGFTIFAILLVLIFCLIQTSCLSSFGGDPEGKRLERIKSSPEYKGEHFENEPFVEMLNGSGYFQVLKRQLFGGEQRVPDSQIPVLNPDPGLFQTPVREGLRAIWFGHASVLIELDGIRIFTDPVFADKVSPFASLGPDRFFPPPIPLALLPKIDAVVISHDHYDHLDMSTVQFLKEKGTKFFVPLGIGAHLEKWGVNESQIVELDWWEKGKVGAVEFVCTPAVHYSGRGLFNRKSTLWSSWSLIGPKNKVFVSGDTGYSPHFSQIGKRLGPFNLTAIKVGAYDWSWDGIHMNPEDAVKANSDVNGKTMLPVHWGTFNLAIHEWKEPIILTVKAANESKTNLVTPKPGQVVEVGSPFHSEPWWENVK